MSGPALADVLAQHLADDFKASVPLIGWGERLAAASLEWVATRLDDPDTRIALADEISGYPIGTGYYTSQVGYHEALEMADLVLAAVKQVLGVTAP